jgi:hypothetical protein
MAGWAGSLARSHARERDRKKIGSELGWQAIPGLAGAGAGAGPKPWVRASGPATTQREACLVCWIPGGRAAGRCESLLRDATLQCTPAQDFAFSGRGFGAGLLSVCTVPTVSRAGGVASPGSWCGSWSLGSTRGQDLLRTAWLSFLRNQPS